MTNDPLTTLRDEVLASDFYDETHAAALAAVEQLVQAARYALPCVDRNSTLPRRKLEEALAPFEAKQDVT
jgi:hypothetical protein